MGQVSALPGGWREGDTVFYTAACQTFPSGDRLMYGARGEVSGSSLVRDGTDHKRVAVQFPGNAGPVACLVTALGREPPSDKLPGGWRIGDLAVYTGNGYTFPDGDVMVHGARGEVVGPCEDIPGAAAVLFPGHKEPVITENLKRDFPWGMCMPCIGCCKAGRTVPSVNGGATSEPEPQFSRNTQNGIAV